MKMITVYTFLIANELVSNQGFLKLIAVEFGKCQSARKYSCDVVNVNDNQPLALWRNSQYGFHLPPFLVQIRLYVVKNKLLLRISYLVLTSTIAN